MRRPYIISNPQNPKFVCDQCYPAMIEIGFVWDRCVVYCESLNLHGLQFDDHWAEYYQNGKYAILGGQGHGHDEDVFFKQKPNTYDTNVMAIHPFDFYEENCDPHTGWDLIQYAIREKWFNPETQWYSDKFLSHVKNLINAWERKNGITVEDFFKKKAKIVVKNLNHKNKERIKND